MHAARDVHWTSKGYLNNQIMIKNKKLLNKFAQQVLQQVQ